MKDGIANSWSLCICHASLVCKWIYMTGNLLSKIKAITQNFRHLLLRFGFCSLEFKTVPLTAEHTLSQEDHSLWMLFAEQCPNSTFPVNDLSVMLWEMPVKTPVSQGHYRYPLEFFTTSGNGAKFWCVGPCSVWILSSNKRTHTDKNVGRAIHICGDSCMLVHLLTAGGKKYNSVS